MLEPANFTAVQFTDAQPAGAAARRWRASLPGELRRRSLSRGGALLGVAAIGYVAAMVGAVWGPNFFWRTISLGAAPLMIGALFIIGHDAAHNSFTPYTWLNRLLGRLVLLPAWHPYTSWVHAHNTLHHGGTNLRGVAARVWRQELRFERQLRRRRGRPVVTDGVRVAF